MYVCMYSTYSPVLAVGGAGGAKNPQVAPKTRDRIKKTPAKRKNNLTTEEKKIYQLIFLHFWDYIEKSLTASI